MKLNHNDYMNYELPSEWCVEYEEDNLLIYNPEGDGAITISFFSVLNSSKSLDEQVSVLAKKFIDKNNIKLHLPLLLYEKEKKKIMLGTGTTPDEWFVKLWIVCKTPKLVFATYQCKNKTKEVEICDSIIESIQFLF